MSYQARLIHELVIERVTNDAGTLDDYGQPLASVDQVDVRGLVQPRTTREVADSRSAGVEISTHVAFLPIATALGAGDAIVKGDERFQVQGVRRFEFGRSPHVEADLQLVTAGELVAAGS